MRAVTLSPRFSPLLLLGALAIWAPAVLGFASVLSPPSCKQVEDIAEIDGPDEGGSISEDELLAAGAALRGAGCVGVADAATLTERFGAWERDGDADNEMGAAEIAACLNSIDDEAEAKVAECIDSLQEKCGRRQLAQRSKNAGLLSSGSIEWKLGERLCCENNEYSLSVFIFSLKAKVAIDVISEGQSSRATKVRVRIDIGETSGFVLNMANLKDTTTADCEMEVTTSRQSLESSENSKVANVFANLAELIEADGNAGKRQFQFSLDDTFEHKDGCQLITKLLNTIKGEAKKAFLETGDTKQMFFVNEASGKATLDLGNYGEYSLKLDAQCKTDDHYAQNCLTSHNFK